MDVIYFELTHLQAVRETLQNANVNLRLITNADPVTIIDDISSAVTKFTAEASVVVISETSNVKFRLSGFILNELKQVRFSKPILFLSDELEPSTTARIQRENSNVVILPVSKLAQGKYAVDTAHLKQAIGYRSSIIIANESSETIAAPPLPFLIPKVSTSIPPSRNGYRIHHLTGDIMYGDRKVWLTPTSKTIMAAFIKSGEETISRAQVDWLFGGRVQSKVISAYMSGLVGQLAADAKKTKNSPRTEVLVRDGKDIWRMVRQEVDVPQKQRTYSQNANYEYSFGGFSVIGNGEDGVYFYKKKIPLAPVLAKTFTALLRAEDELVSRDAIHQAVYGSPCDTRYQETHIVNNIRALGHALENAGFVRPLISKVEAGYKHYEYRLNGENIPRPSSPGRPAFDFDIFATQAWLRL